MPIKINRKTGFNTLTYEPETFVSVASPNPRAIHQSTGGKFIPYIPGIWCPLEYTAFCSGKNVNGESISELYFAARAYTTESPNNYIITDLAIFNSESVRSDFLAGYWQITEYYPIEAPKTFTIISTRRGRPTIGAASIPLNMNIKLLDDDSVYADLSGDNVPVSSLSNQFFAIPVEMMELKGITIDAILDYGANYIPSTEYPAVPISIESLSEFLEKNLTYEEPEERGCDKLGGYQMVDMRGIDLGVKGSYKISGIYELIEGTKKSIKLVGLKKDGQEWDCFVNPIIDGENFVFSNVYNEVITVTPDDIVQI